MEPEPYYHIEIVQKKRWWGWRYVSYELYSPEGKLIQKSRDYTQMVRLKVILESIDGY